MAHFILEYSNNIGAGSLQLQGLFEKLHAAAQATGLFPLKGIRSRAFECQDFRMADGNPDHVFVHLQVLMGAGRTQEQRETAAQSFFKVFEEHYASLFDDRGVAMSFELKELEAITKFNKNNIQEFL